MRIRDSREQRYWECLPNGYGYQLYHMRKMLPFLSSHIRALKKATHRPKIRRARKFRID